MAKKSTTEKRIDALERSLLSHILMLDAIFEILAERRILTGEEVLSRIKKLKTQSSLGRSKLN